MKYVSKFAVIALSAACLGIFVVTPTRGEVTTQPSSDTQSATGSISGTVTKDGKPLANARIGLVVRQHQRKTGKKGANNTDSATTQPSDGEKAHQRPTPTATTTTDANGKFTLADVPAGEYVIIAGVRGEGRGHERVAVNPGETATVEIPVAVPGDKTGGKRVHKLGI